MRRVLISLILALFFLIDNSKAQNLVPNSSFEDTVACPFNLIQLYQADGWTINVNSSDYFHTCASPFSHVSVPSAFGYQWPHTGDAFAGFAAKRKGLQGEENREYLGRELSSPLIPGTRYYVSFYVSLNYLICGVSKIGILFTNNFLGDTTILPTPLINNFAHVYADSIVTDTLGWTKISGSFIADSAYQYFMIGLFFDDAHIDSLYIQDSVYTVCSNYYYVDDVCVSPDQSTCNIEPTSSQILMKPTTSIFPNPVSDYLTIKIIKEEALFMLYDLLGKEVLATKLHSGTNRVELKELTSGMYIYKLLGESKTGKILVN